MTEPNVVTLHIRYRLLLRHMRGYALAVFSICVGLFLIALSVAHFTRSNRTTPARPPSAASALVLIVGGLLTIACLVWGLRRVGYYARQGEVGTIDVLGRRTAFRQPLVRFHRFTMTNWRWLRFMGMGWAVSVPVIVGVNAAGKRALAITPITYIQVEIDRFLAASGMPIEGDWSDRVGRFSVRKRWPGSKDTRRQGWIALGAILPSLLLLTGTFVAAALLLR